MAKYKIAYNVLYDGYADDYEIFVMNADGSDKRNISSSAGIDWVYHAVGDRLYFISDRDSTKRKYFLYEMKWDGTEVRRVTDFLVHDSWVSSRKNGTELVIVPDFGDSVKRDLFIIDLNGNILEQVTNDEYHNNDPVFSPDGKQIVFRSYHTDIDELFIINSDGTGLRQLTDYPVNDSSALSWEYHAGPPKWVDNENVSYISKQNSNYSIYTINIQTKEISQLTRDVDEDGNLRSEGWHSWSADGKLISYNSTDLIGNYDIYVMNADKSGKVRLTSDKWYEQAPVFVYPKSE